uniref:SYD n=1 Tax=Arundo donax TaxID=35708 RepID=A0A0A9CNG9_ARUDO
MMLRDILGWSRMQNLIVLSNYCERLRNIYRNLETNYRVQSPQMVVHLMFLIRVTLQTILKMRATSHSIIWKVMRSTINWPTV